ncbi:FitA-like ribbon-helix-helix domain-containing protein [Leucobacter insecticola]|uniref:FitA-like ribbon-helix-helix domain-containing protein n=1 Tax=Leucobacter insecticola TaxID=2714934 RepID=UPI003CC748E4
MSMIQVRNVPEDLHRKLKMRAASEGLTLSDFALRELEHAAALPSRAELNARLADRTPRPYNGETAAESVRAERDAR